MGGVPDITWRLSKQSATPTTWRHSVPYDKGCGQVYYIGIDIVILLLVLGIYNRFFYIKETLH